MDPIDPTPKEDEPITEEMLREVILHEEEREQTSTDFDYSSYTPTPPSRVHSIKLSYKRIPAIHNLGALTQLVELRLDNNKIKKMEGMETLVNLELLDLSFNEIEVVEGLETLSKLKELSLYGNRIRKVEGMEGCKDSLEVLSLGNNEIEPNDTVLYFRPFSKLRALSLDGNPMCASNPEYRVHAMAFLQQLCYIDYTLIKPDDRRAAREGGVSLEELQMVEDRDRERAAEVAVERKKSDRIAALAAHGIESRVTLFPSLFADDADWNRLLALPGVVELHSAFRDKVADLEKPFEDEGLMRSQAILGEIRTFERARKAILAEAEVEAAGAVRRYLDAQEAAFQAFRTNAREWMQAAATAADPFSVPPMQRELLTNLREECGAMQKALRQGEVELGWRTRHILDKFDSSIKDLSDTKLKVHAAFFRGVDGEERLFQEDIVALVNRVLESVTEAFAAKEDGPPAVDEDTPPRIRRNRLPPELADIPDDLLRIIDNREELMGIVLSAKDARDRKYNDADNAATKWEIARRIKVITDARKAEAKRNRARLYEIAALQTASERAIRDEFERFLDFAVAAHGDEFVEEVLFPSIDVDPTEIKEPADALDA